MEKYSYKFNNTVDATTFSDILMMALDHAPADRYEAVALATIRELHFRLSQQTAKAMFSGKDKLSFLFTYTEAQSILIAYQEGWMYGVSAYATNVMIGVSGFLDQKTAFPSCY
jgi:hypothetical protein